MLVVGQFVGETGLAAISNASKLCYIINSICIGMTMGGAVLIAQYKGANNKKGQAETFQMLSMLSLATSILLTVISLAGYQPVSYTHLDVYKRQFLRIPLQGSVQQSLICL